MTNTTLPSQPIAVVDVPEVKWFGASFVYNFFVPDELMNDTGVVPGDIVQKSGESLDAGFIEQFDERRRTPRYVRLNFTPVELAAPDFSNTSQQGSDSAKLDTAQNAPAGHAGIGFSSKGVSISANLKKIVTEAKFSNAFFSGMSFQDTHIDGKLYYIASGSISSRINAFIPPVKLSSQQPYTSKPGGMTLIDMSTYLNSVTPENIAGEIASSVMNQPDALGLIYSEAGKQLTNNVFSEVKDVSVKVQLNNKFISRLLRHLVYETTTIYGDEINAILPIAKNIEDVAKSAVASAGVNVNEYTTQLPHVMLKEAQNGPSIMTSRVVGYIIDKYEIVKTQQGVPDTWFAHKPIIVEHEKSSAALDFGVRYSGTYTYSIRTIVAVEMPALNPVTKQRMLATILVSSRGSPRVTVSCMEKVPPPPPADFNITWDYTAHAPRLTWSFPPNSQRDIKKFQVFKREKVSQPYRLTRMFDFNDAKPAMPDIETPALHLVENTAEPVLIHIDDTFRVGDPKLGKTIYTMCSIDAHGLSSNYCEQIHVEFDRYKNVIVKKMVSHAGAPKSYPNVNLQQDLFVDSIRDSGHTHMRVLFSPEALSITDANGTDIGYIGTADNKTSYKLQLINIDYQKQQDVDINIHDRRKKSMNVAAGKSSKTNK